MVLSKRLKAVTDLLPKGQVVADIGCDHGYISIRLVSDQIYERAIAMDVRKGPLAIAVENISRENLTDRIETRLSDGLNKLEVGEADAAIIAGMGGQLLIGILNRSIDKAKNLKYMVLQPQSDIHMVRGYLRDNGFAILKEDMVKDEGKFYPMFLVTYAGSVNNDCANDLQEIYDYYGQYLIDNRNEVLLEYLDYEKDILEEVLRKVPVENATRREELAHSIVINRHCKEMMI